MCPLNKRKKLIVVKQEHVYKRTNTVFKNYRDHLGFVKIKSTLVVFKIFLKVGSQWLF